MWNEVNALVHLAWYISFLFPHRVVEIEEHVYLATAVVQFIA